MPREREHSSKRIKTVDYDIEGNYIRAWYDGAGDLIFVLDETINADKPNVLLVIDSFDERKWDDVLSNDYGIDLETVRPKKDNKYQKLDIEYGGLDVYAELIEAYESDDDLDEPLENLMRFRTMSVRRAAKERLAAAEETADKSRETIERTNDTISDLRARLKELRAKLSEQKRNIGREPTKSSASKILKTEAQIDATNEKLARAKKRLESAKRRLAVAEEDAEIARAILARRADVKPVRRVKSVSVKKRAPVVSVREGVDDEDDVDDTDNEEDEYSEEYDDTEPYETKAEEMADEEVKPLFDTDPEVLDDNIAFKPIDFNASSASAPEQKLVEPVATPTPLSFAPPSDADVSQYEDTSVGVENKYDAPVLENLTSVQQEPEQNNIAPAIEPVVFDSGVATMNDAAPVLSETVIEEPQPAPVTEVEPLETIVAVEPVTPTRPVSPIVENHVNQTDVHYSKKPTLVYYIMLILLIIVSIFTLWLYQQKNGAVLPDLAMTTTASDVDSTVSKTEVAETNIPSPFVKASDDKVEVKTEVTPAVEPVKEPEPVVETVEPVVEPEPVAVAVAEPEPVTVSEPEPVNVSVESPFVELRTVATYEPEKKPIPSEAEILARKPGYNVSQNEKMFVASPDYDTETLVESNSGVDATYSMDVDVQPMPVPEIVASEVTSVESSLSEPEGCADGMPADANGCCPGEEYSYTDDGYMCCADDGCFPPLQ